MSQARHARPTKSKYAARAVLTAGVGAGLAIATTGAASAAGGYTVKKGDTLSEIAQQYHTDWHKLARINHLADPDLILIGQQLKLTAPAAKATGKHTKKVHTDHVSKSAARHAKAKHSKPSRSAARPHTSSKASMTSAWRKVANCESSLNPRAVNPAGYYGLFQFDLRTWRSVGGHGNPINASAAEQYLRAKMLYAKRGASPWPVCGRYLR
jgi:LysM repeat protein